MGVLDDLGELTCRVYWGIHSCCLPRGHAGDHLCQCVFEPESGKRGRPPYYGLGTRLHGADVDRLPDWRDRCDDDEPDY